MFANLITTILVALGVATGNVSSNVYKGGNAFNNEIEINETKPIKKAATETTLVEENGYITAQDIGTRETERSTKYYLNNSTGSNYTNPYLHISNTIYNYTKVTTPAPYRIYTSIIYKITNYYQSTMNNILVKSDYRVYTSSQQTAHYAYNRFIYLYEEEKVDNVDTYIDKTLTNATTAKTIAQELLEITDYTTRLFGSAEVDGTSLGNNRYYFDINNSFTIDNLEANNTMTIVVINEIWTYNGQSWMELTTNPSATPNPTSGLKITGFIRDITINYEIVDIPNLMFTIITLPFSWYSTAFNLTVFPGTPYALNFGNLILTIVAALILLYLIRKIIK